MSCQAHASRLYAFFGSDVHYDKTTGADHTQTTYEDNRCHHYDISDRHLRAGAGAGARARVRFQTIVTAFAAVITTRARRA